MLRTVGICTTIVLLLACEFWSVTLADDDFSLSPLMKRAPNFIRFGRSSRPNFIRFGKRSRSPTFIRFGRSDADDELAASSVKTLNKRPNFIRFGRSYDEADD
uniref:Uncharacterized protein n=1 Tax=Plectus sambesii TaxID=2011161 RepID=A0A914VMW0_9BILA